MRPVNVCCLVLLILLLGCEQRGPVDLPALEGRARSGDPAAMSRLVELLGAGENELNRKVYPIVLELGAKIEPALLERVDSDDREQREYVVAALGTLQSAAAVEPVAALLRDHTRGRRYIAAWALGEIGAPAAIPALVAALGDPDGEVRRFATRSLIRFNRDAVEPLLKVVRTGSPVAAAGAIRALGDIGDRRALEPLLDQLDGPNRIDALLALGKLKDRRAEAALVALLDNPEWRVRMNAAMALGPLGGAAAIEPLRITLEDEVKVVREWSARSLEMITGEHVLYRNGQGEYVTPYHVYH